MTEVVSSFTSPNALGVCRCLHAVLELADLIVSRLDRLVEPFDQLMALALQFPALQRRLPFLLEIILTALDFVDDGFLVAAGDCGLEVLEPLVRLAEE